MTGNLKEIKDALSDISARVGGRLDEMAGRLGDAEERLAGVEDVSQQTPQLRGDVDALAEQVRRRAQRTLTRAFGADGGYRGSVFDGATKAAEFGKFALDAVRRDATAETDAAGGYLVPQEFVPELVRAVEEQGVLRKEARVVPIAGKQSNWPKRSGGVTTYWVTPGATITAGDMTFGQVTLTATKLAALVIADSELSEQSSVALGEILATEFAYAFATEEDRVGFNGGGGAGDGNATGVLSASDVNVVTMGSTKTGFTDLSYDNLVDMEAAVVSEALSNAKWYVHRSILALIKKLKDSQSYPLWQPPAASEPGTLLGYPVRVVDALPAASATAVSTKFMVFGDLRMGVYVGDRRRMTLAQSEHVQFEADQVAYRATEEVAIVVAEGNALVVLKTAAS